MQTVGAALGEQLVDETDEDCLSLNVWTPAPDDRRRPVLVWLHGGVFMFDYGSREALGVPFSSSVSNLLGTFTSTLPTVTEVNDAVRSQSHQVTHRCSIPPVSTSRACKSSRAVVRRISGNRGISRAKASCNSSRASGAPMQYREP